ncbi:hypothetical protein JZ751_016393 [Albula glossodonta]|uniref:Uncharacterized protein n=1 Tax=Albula glossodonta TaxID=121402 RepID=A0A8T2NTG6_9TELE|nr:hypothetical protein JZ751_016393 [Albula glossodonta]
MKSNHRNQRATIGLRASVHVFRPLYRRVSVCGDSHSDDFDPASTKSKYDSMDFDSLLREAQRSLRRWGEVWGRHSSQSAAGETVTSPCIAVETARKGLGVWGVGVLGFGV